MMRSADDGAGDARLAACVGRDRCLTAEIDRLRLLLGWMGDRQLDHDIAAPRLPGDNRTAPAQCLDKRNEIADHGREVVAMVRLVGPPVTALVDRDDGMTGRGEVGGHAVPRRAFEARPCTSRNGTRSPSRPAPSVRSSMSDPTRIVRSTELIGSPSSPR